MVGATAAITGARFFRVRIPHGRDTIPLNVPPYSQSSSIEGDRPDGVLRRGSNFEAWYANGRDSLGDRLSGPWGEIGDVNRPGEVGWGDQRGTCTGFTRRME